MTFKKKNNKKKTKKTAHLSKPMKKAVDKMIKGNAETKYTVVSYDSVNIAGFPTAPIENHILQNVSQGDTALNNRIGNSIRTQYIKFRLLVNMIANATPEVARVRAVLYEPVTVTTPQPTFTILNMGDRFDPHQYRVHFDHIFQIDDDAGGKSREFHFTIPYKRKVTYSGAAGNTIQDHDLRMYFSSDSQVAPDPIITGYIEVGFKDS